MASQANTNPTGGGAAAPTGLLSIGDRASNYDELERRRAQAALDTKLAHKRWKRSERRTKDAFALMRATTDQAQREAHRRRYVELRDVRDNRHTTYCAFKAEGKRVRSLLAVPSSNSFLATGTDEEPDELSEFEYDSDDLLPPRNPGESSSSSSSSARRPAAAAAAAPGLAPLAAPEPRPAPLAAPALAPHSTPPVETVRDSARALLDPPSPLPYGVTLFDCDTRRINCAKYRNATSENFDVRTRVATVLRFIVGVGRQCGWKPSEHALQGRPLETRHIVERQLLFTPRGANTSSRVVANGRYKTTRCVVRSVITGMCIYNRIKHESAKFLHYGNIKIGALSCNLAARLQDYVESVSAMPSSECGTYDPSSDALLRAVWEAVLVFVDRYMTWCIAGKQTQKMVHVNVGERYRGVRADVDGVWGVSALVHADSLAARLQCVETMCFRMAAVEYTSEFIEVDVTDMDERLPYPVGAEFDPYHPCDAALRCILGSGRCDNPVEGVVTADYEGGPDPTPLDQVTRNVTARKYGFRENSINAHVRPENRLPPPCCLPRNDNEAMLHSMFHGGRAGATTMSGYDPMGVFMHNATPGPRIAWFPGCEDVQRMRDDATWASMPGELLRNYTVTAEYVAGLVRSNFCTVFNKAEARLAKDMMLYSGDDSASSYMCDAVTFDKFVRMCFEFMRGPVWQCVKRRGWTEMFNRTWTVPAAALRDSVTGDPDRLGEDTAALVGLLRAMMATGAAVVTANIAAYHGHLRQRVRDAGGFAGPLRMHLFERASRAIASPSHPLKAYFASRPATAERCGEFSDAVCSEIMHCDTEFTIFPNLRSWVFAVRGAAGGDTVDVAGGIALWLCRYVHAHHTRDAGFEVPEPMVASFPYLERMAIAATLFVTALGARYAGLTTTDDDVVVHALLTDGIARETYEWDSTFVRRLAVGRRYHLRWSRVAKLTDAVCEWGAGGGSDRNVELARAGVIAYMLECMMHAGGDPGGEGPPPRCGVGGEIGRAMEATFGNMGGWFAREMRVYGMFYAHYFEKCR